MNLEGIWLQMAVQCGHWLISFQPLLIDQLLPGQPLPGQLLPGSPALPDMLLFYVQNQQTLLSNRPLKSVLNQKFKRSGR